MEKEDYPYGVVTLYMDASGREQKTIIQPCVPEHLREDLLHPVVIIRYLDESGQERVAKAAWLEYQPCIRIENANGDTPPDLRIPLNRVVTIDVTDKATCECCAFQVVAHWRRSPMDDGTDLMRLTP